MCNSLSNTNVLSGVTDISSELKMYENLSENKQNPSVPGKGSSKTQFLKIFFVYFEETSDFIVLNSHLEMTSKLIQFLQP